MSLTQIRTLLLDTNSWLTYFLRRKEDLEAIDAVVAFGTTNDLTLAYAPTTAKDLFYIIPRALRERGGGNVSYKPAAWACLNRLMEIAVAAPQTLGECELARMLSRECSDFEDNLILAAASTIKADYVVTSDKRLLKAMPEDCITPARAVELLGLEIPDA